SAEFLAMLLVIVYVGGVAVRFLFVVMMLDIEFAELRAGFVSDFPLGGLGAVSGFIELVAGVGDGRAGLLGSAQLAPSSAGDTPNIEAIGHLLYTRYIFLFEMAGLILLVAMIGAIVLTHRARGGVRAQKVARQNRRRPQDAIRNVNPPVGQGVEL